jgi:hypothetical protein
VRFALSKIGERGENSLALLIESVVAQFIGPLAMTYSEKPDESGNYKKLE